MASLIENAVLSRSALQAVSLALSIRLLGVFVPLGVMRWRACCDALEPQ